MTIPDNNNENIFPEFTEHISEEELYQVIEKRVAFYLDSQPDILMSYLYRLDVLEKDIKAVLAPGYPMPPIQALSQLILERQKSRIATKKKYKQDQIPGWEF